MAPKKRRRRFVLPIAGAVGILPLALAARDSQPPTLGLPSLVDIAGTIPRSPVEGEKALAMGALAPDTATVLPTMMVVAAILVGWGVYLAGSQSRRRRRSGWKRVLPVPGGGLRLRTIYRRRAGMVVASVGATLLLLGTREYAEGAYAQRRARAAWARIDRGGPAANADFPNPRHNSAALIPMPSEGSRTDHRHGSPVARLIIDSIDLDEIVLEGVGPAELNGGPGHYPGSALPGERGNAIISAHRDRHFRRFGELRIGSRIRTETLADTTEWVVTDRRIVSRHTPALYNEAEATLTLTTCWPIRYFGPAPDRLILVAKPAA